MKGVPTAEIRMLGKQPSVRRGDLMFSSLLPKMPVLTVGRYYLVFATRPSAVGLSATVGLGQGCFTIYQNGKDETVANEVNNSGLFRDMAPVGVGARTLAAEPSASPSSGGPMPYSELAGQIRSVTRAGRCWSVHLASPSVGRAAA